MSTIFKCKMCGGTLEINNNETIAVCEYCGTKQTIPTAKDENLQGLYNRANTLRIKAEFDKAEQLYEKILQSDDTQSEAYWGLILCKYGIEYVDDPVTAKKIPTCHRASFDSIIADEDYKSALAYADASQKDIYEAEAKEIDRIQKEIIELSAKEEPYDVFICYKETDESGKRTQDSAIANDIYYQLTQEGFKVFYAAITLEDKLGSAYEPCIFAALNSAKVMLAIGTKPEYFNAVWVKNEWSRFLKIIKKDRSKLLIPCYKDMDAYELPDEFAHLQAQDMGKIGFINDVVRGIKKVVDVQVPKTTATKEASAPIGNANTAPLLRRVYLFLEDGDWNSADEYCEKVLDLDPECGEAYLGKLMVQLKVRRKEKLGEQAETFDDNPNYQKAMRFGDANLQNELEDYIKTITDRAEHSRLLEIYKKGEAILKSAKTEEEFMSASRIFAQISGFEDSEARVNECKEKANEMHFGGLYAAALALMKSAKTEEDFAKAQSAFEEIKEYKDSEKLAKECAEKADNINKNAIYSAAIALMNGNKARNYKKAIAEFEKIQGFKDADQKIEYCNKKIEQINEAISLAGYEKQNRAEERAEAFKENLPLIKKIALIVAPVLVVTIVCVTVLPKIDWSKKPPVDTTNTSSINTSVKPENTVTSNTSTEQAPSSSENSISSKQSSTLSNPTSNKQPSANLSSESPTNSTKPQISETTSINNKSQWADGEMEYGDFVIGKSNNEITILTYFGDSANIVIPSEINGVSVTSIRDVAFFACRSLSSISIPNSVTSIGEGAFNSCSSLTSITIPNSVTSIGDRTFSGCTSLITINIPNSVTSIGDGAFSDCTSLATINIPNSVTSIGVSAFAQCSSLTTIKIPDSITSISEDAFDWCSSLTVYFQSEAQKEKFRHCFRFIPDEQIIVQ